MLRAGSWFDRRGTAVQLAACLSLLALFTLAASLFTLEADEANILISAYHLFGLPVPQESAATYPTTTSGGLYPLIHGLLGLLTTDVLAHRAVSLVLAALFVATTYRLLRQLEVSPPLAMAGAAMSAATPGFILVGSAATAELMSTLLLLAGLLVWTRAGRRAVVPAFLAGLLFGLACAARLNAIFILPAVALYALDFEAGWRRKLGHPALACATALVVLVLAIQAYLLAADPQGEGALGVVTGASLGKDAFILSRYLLVANDWLPLWVIAAIGGMYFAAGRKVLARKDRQFTALLLLGGVIGWLMWIFRAPIPHVRYLWPALPCLWLGGIITAATLIERWRSEAARTAFHLAALVACFYQGMTGLFIVAQGDSLVVNYQLNRTSPMLWKGPQWTAAADQRAMANMVKSLPAQADIYILNRNLGFPITYWSGRAVAPLADAVFSDRPAYMLALPGNFAVWRPSPDITAWRERHAREVWRQGNYAIFQIEPNAPPAPLEMVQVGDNDIYPERREAGEPHP